MILLDTNICIYIINAKPPAVLARFQQYRMGDVGLCSVVAAELAFGVAKSGSARNRQALEMFLAPLTILPFDDAAVWAYGDLRADLDSSADRLDSYKSRLDAARVEGVMEKSVSLRRIGRSNCLSTRNVSWRRCLARLQRWKRSRPQ